MVTRPFLVGGNNDVTDRAPTPRTDELLSFHTPATKYNDGASLVGLCRTLERELAEANRRLATKAEAPPNLSGGASEATPTHGRQDCMKHSEGEGAAQAGAYVAWCCYGTDDDDGTTTIQLCDSDHPGAFKVYRLQSRHEERNDNA